MFKLKKDVFQWKNVLSAVNNIMTNELKRISQIPVTKRCTVTQPVQFCV